MEVAKGGYRKDLKQFFRSKWEANLARYYRYIGEFYIYEYMEFEFKTIKRGQRYYKPDFYLPASDSWVELKGFFRASDKTKLRRFKKYYPEEFARLRFIIEDPYARTKANAEVLNFLMDDLKIDFSEIESYNSIEKALGKLIPNWE